MLVGALLAAFGLEEESLSEVAKGEDAKLPALESVSDLDPDPGLCPESTAELRGVDDIDFETGSRCERPSLRDDTVPETQRSAL